MSKKDLLPLIAATTAAYKKAYAPYSKFHVGAALYDEKNNIHSGCNVENSAYPIGCCAEQAAVAAMILAGGHRIKDIVIQAHKNNPCPPCGACRQIIAEHGNADTRIHLVNPDQSLSSYRIEELLPQAFSTGHFK